MLYVFFFQAPSTTEIYTFCHTRSLHDALPISALVVLPLLPSAAVDPWGVLRPDAVWRLVVLVMGVGVLGHIAQRAAGTRWGLPLAGFFAGFVSSTAAVAGYGAVVRQQPRSAAPDRKSVGAGKSVFGRLYIGG